MHRKLHMLLVSMPIRIYGILSFFKIVIIPILNVLELINW